jgi:hypothetical protein
MRVQSEEDSIRIDLSTSEDEFYTSINMGRFDEGGRCGSIYLSLPLKLAKEMQAQLTKAINELEPSKEETK